MNLRVLLLLCAAGCRTTAVPATPWVSDSGDIAVTLDQPFGVSTSWEGECNPGLFDIMVSAPTPGGRKTVPCNYVDYDVKVACENDACTARVTNDSILITPTKLGVLKAKITLDPTNPLRRKHVVDLKPVFVVAPTSAAAICDLAKNGEAQVDVSLYGTNKQLVHTSQVRVVGGEECRTNTEIVPYGVHKREYTCKVDALNARLEVSNKSYKLETSAACNLIYPSPATSSARVAPEPHAFWMRDPYNNECQFLIDRTKTTFAEWGWQVGQIDDHELKKTEHGVPSGKATLAAERLGAKVLVTITYVAEGDDPGCTWSLATTAKVKGTHELPNF